MLSLFRTNQSFASLLLFGYAILLQLPVILIGSRETAVEGGETYLSGMLSATLGSHWLLTALAPPVLVAVAGIVANNVCDRFRLSRAMTQFPGLMVVLLWALVPAFHTYHPVQINYLLLILAIGALGSTYKSKTIEVARFNAGFWLGVASLLFPSYLIFLLAFVIGIGIFRTAGPKSIAQLLVGVLVPYLLLATYAYWHDKLEVLYTAQLEGFGFGRFASAGPFDLAGIGLFSVLIVVVLFSGQRSRALLSIEGAKNLSFIYWVLLFSLPVAAFTDLTEVKDAQVAIIPLGILMGMWLERRSETKAEFYHMILFATAVIFTVMSLVN